jgi:hypothetical protein
MRIEMVAGREMLRNHGQNNNSAVEAESGIVKRNEKDSLFIAESGLWCTRCSSKTDASYHKWP